MVGAPRGCVPSVDFALHAMSCEGRVRCRQMGGKAGATRAAKGDSSRGWTPGKEARPAPRGLAFRPWRCRARRGFCWSMSALRLGRSSGLVLGESVPARDRSAPWTLGRGEDPSRCLEILALQDTLEDIAVRPRGVPASVHGRGAVCVSVPDWSGRAQSVRFKVTSHTRPKGVLRSMREA